MKLSKLRILAPMLILALTFGLACSDEDNPANPQQGNAKVRVIHTSYDAPAVDISIDGQVAISELAYGQSSGYAETLSGMRNAKVTPTGETSPVVIEADLELAEDSDYTVFAVNQLSSIEPVVSMDERASNPTMAKIRFLHASPDAPAVDIKLNSGDGPAVFSNRSFKNISPYTMVDAGSYTFVVTAAGSTDEVVRFNPVSVTNGNVYTVVAHGTLNGEDDYPFAVRIFIDNGDGNSFVDLTPASAGPMSKIRVIHTSYDAPAVDVWVDGSVAIADLGYGMSSGYASVNSGNREIQVTPNGQTAPVVIDANLNLNEDTDYTVFAVDQLAMISPVVAEDSRNPVSGMAKIRFLHASPDAPAVDIKLNSGDGPVVFQNKSFKNITEYAEVAAGSYVFAVTPAGLSAEVVRFMPAEVAGGGVYTVVAHGTLDGGDMYPFAVRVFVDSDPGNAYLDLVPEMSHIRVIHTSYDAPSVDIWVDGVVGISDLSYGMSSGYASLWSGTRNIAVTPSGSSSPLVIEADLALDVMADYTVFAINELSMITPLVTEDMRDANPNMAKVRFLHASPDAPAVDIKLNSGDGPVVFGNQAFGNISEYAEVDGSTYTFAVTAAGSTDEVLVFDPITVEDGNLYTVVAHGTLDAGDMYPFAVRVFVDNGDGNAYVDMTPATSNVMVIHASPDAPGVDLLVDDIVLNSSALEFPDNTGYLDIASGNRNVKVNVSGTDVTVIDANLNLDADQAYSIFAIDEVANIAPLVIADDLTSPASGMAHARFIHLSPDAPAVDITLTDGTVVFGNTAFGEYTSFTPVNAGAYDLQVRLEGTDTVVLNLPGIELMDGGIYTVFAKGFAAGEPSLGAEIIQNN